MARKANNPNQARLIAIKKTHLAANTDARFQEIAWAAYFRAQTRDHVPSSETEDWIEAKREIDAMSIDSV